MMLKFFLPLFILICCTSFSPTETKLALCNITVKATGINNAKGIMEFALYNNSKVFPEVGKTYRLIRKKVSSKEVSVTFVNVPVGKYAACIYHDVNSNNNCDKNFFGIPTEGYGFSNNIRPVFSAPSFEDCAIYVKADRVVSIKLIY